MSYVMHNYIHISLRSVLNEIVGKLIHKRLYGFLQKNSILHKFQFMFQLH